MHMPACLKPIALLSLFPLVLFLAPISMIGCSEESGLRSNPGDSGDPDPDVFEKVTVANSLGMKFNLVPSKTFRMGSPDDEPGRDGDEVLHFVTLSRAYYLQTTEVTQSQWRRAMENNPSAFTEPEACTLDYQECTEECDDCPVESVSWNDAQEYIAALNAMDEGVYRLPTEAEWEHAARAGSDTAFPNGEITVITSQEDPNLNEIGWYKYNCTANYDFSYTCRPQPVGRKTPSAWGFYDMHGNVYEWCQDWYAEYPATDVTDPAGPEEGAERVRRGGSWDGQARGCRSANRASGAPDLRLDNMGLRLVWEPPPA